MRAIITLLSLVVTASSSLAAQNYRPATEAEIRRELPGSKSLSITRNGFLYEPGGKVGYRFSKGELCVRNGRGKVDCVRVDYNGEALRMTDRYGNRDTMD